PRRIDLPLRRAPRLRSGKKSTYSQGCSSVKSILRNTLRCANMNRILAAALLVLGPGAAVAAAQDRLGAEYESAFHAWDRGDYVPALESFQRILDARGGDAYFERIALLTGELYTTAE